MVAAGCTLPLTDNPVGIPVHTRHKAALGMSEQSDALILVVSEETGIISAGLRGQDGARLRDERLRDRLIQTFTGRDRPARRRRGAGATRALMPSAEAARPRPQRRRCAAVFAPKRPTGDGFPPGRSSALSLIFCRPAYARLLRDNLPYKLLALAFAVLLHFYVASQQNPARLLTVPLTLRNLPPDCCRTGRAAPGHPDPQRPADELDGWPSPTSPPPWT